MDWNVQFLCRRSIVQLVSAATNKSLSLISSISFYTDETVAAEARQLRFFGNRSTDRSEKVVAVCVM